MRGTWQTTDSGGGGLVLAVITAMILLGSGAASAIAHALVAVLIIIACTTTLTVAAGIGVLIWRVRHRSPVVTRPVIQLTAETRPRLEASSRQDIEAPRVVHLHLNVTPDQLAAIMRHYTEEN